MSNFAFLETAEWQDIARAAQAAERYAASDPRTALFHGRRTVELLVLWLFTFDPDFRQPYDDRLSALLADISFKNHVPHEIQEKMHALRRLGNLAVHNARPIRPGQARQMVRELFHVAHWFARTYTTGDPNAVPDRLRSELVPAAPAAAPQQSRADLQALEAELEARDTALRAAREREAALQEQIRQLQEQTARQKAINEVVPDTHDYSEADTRALLIDVYLREAGWDPGAANVREVRVAPMPNRQGYGYADYVLWGADGKPLAVVEAKKASVDKERGKQQAKLYADALEAMHGRRPLIFYTNGYEIALWDDLNYAPREVRGFYTRDQLALLVQRRSLRRPLGQLEVDRGIVDRYYQLEAIRRVAERLDQGHRQALLVMATGTGKTRVAVALVDLLMRANRLKRVLFLADRNALVNQALRAFKSYLPAGNPVNLVEDKEAREARVVVSTYPTIMNQIELADDEGRRLFGVGHFDLIIIDEAHRSVYQKYGAIFDYFDSLLLGLTATPKDEVDRNTYRLFNLEPGVPTYAYGLEEAVQDGFLVPPRLLETETKFLREGIHYDDLSDDEKAEWDRIEWDESGNVPDAVDPAALNQWLFNEDTVDKVLAALLTHGLKVAGGDRLGKTIIFAKNHRHAEFIRERFDANYPHLRGQFARVVDHYATYAHTLIDDFSHPEKSPHIAVSVDMLDTGIDVPEVVNLVFFKLIRSKTKFWQMIGRGTRLRPELFGPEQDKAYFLVFDFCQNFEFFRVNPQGRPEGRVPEPLRQRIFKTQLDLLEALRDESDPQLAPLRGGVVDRLHAYVAGMNADNFLVRPERRHVEPFQERARWDRLSPSDLQQLAQHVSGLPSELADEPETAKRFDLLIHHLQLALLSREERAVTALRNRIVRIAGLLGDKASIPAVAARLELIRRVQTDAFWAEITLPQLEDLRRAPRDLPQFIERQEQKAIRTDFADELGELREGYVAGATTGINTAQYRKKVEQFLRSHDDYVVIHKIRWAMALSDEDLAALEAFLFAAEEIGDPTQFARAFNQPRNLPAFIRSLVGLDRRAAKEKFAAFLDQQRFTADQIQFVNWIIDHLTRNGTMPPEMLYERPYTDLHPTGLDGIFEDEQATALVGILREINGTVESYSA